MKPTFKSKKTEQIEHLKALVENKNAYIENLERKMAEQSPAVEAKTLEQCKDEVAKSKGFKNWNDLTLNAGQNQILDRYCIALEEYIKVLKSQQPAAAQQQFRELSNDDIDKFRLEYIDECKKLPGCEELGADVEGYHYIFNAGAQRYRDELRKLNSQQQQNDVDPVEFAEWLRENWVYNVNTITGEKWYSSTNSKFEIHKKMSLIELYNLYAKKWSNYFIIY